MKLRGYQLDCFDAVRVAWTAGKRAPLLVLPTGAGKTVVFAWLTQHLVSQGSRVLILVHRRELLHQAARKLDQLGIDHDLIMPGVCYGHRAVAVGSVQTVSKRDNLFFDYVIIDEGHHAVAGQWKQVLDRFKAARVLGVTATPCRLDNRGLGDVYDHLILGPSVAQLIEWGHLVKPTVFAYPRTIEVGLRKGEYDLVKFAERAPTITGSALEHYRRHCEFEPAIAFCASVVHAEQVAREFTAAGYPFRAVHGKLSDRDRAAAFDDYRRGTIIGLTSVDLISEGTDLPFATAAILLRPTTSTALYLQQVGRVLRPAAPKTRAVVLDHVGNSLEHGMPDDDRAWSLDGVKRLQSVIAIRQCKTCYRVYESGARCPYCNSVNTVAVDRTPVAADGELIEVSAYDIAKFKAEKKQAYSRARSYAEVLALTQKYGDKPGFAFKYWFSKRRPTARGDAP